METNLQTWLIVVFVGFLVATQLSVIVFMARVATLLKPLPGRPGLREMPARLMETMEAVQRATRTMIELLDRIRPIVIAAAVVSKRQLGHADPVIDQVLNDVANVNWSMQKVASVVDVPLREVLARSAGTRSATAAFFRRAGNSNKGPQC